MKELGSEPDAPPNPALTVLGISFCVVVGLVGVREAVDRDGGTLDPALWSAILIGIVVGGVSAVTAWWLTTRRASGVSPIAWAVTPFMVVGVALLLISGPAYLLAVTSVTISVFGISLLTWWAFASRRP